MHFHRYHALGNDYLVIEPDSDTSSLTPEQIVRICHRHYGVGSDGILWGPLPGRDGAEFALRIFNPDGSEAEKSGNGLRIFCRYLFDSGRVAHQPFHLATAGGIVEARVHEGAREVTVAMGQVSFLSSEIPVAGEPREVLAEVLQVGGERLVYSAATIGNPHCVIDVAASSIAERLDRGMVERLGPLIEHEARFPRRTNVQFLRVRGRDRIAIEIWERGAGYTLASGSSSCAAAAVARRLGRVDARVQVEMPGGVLAIEISPEYCLTMCGAVTRIASGTIDPEMFADPLPKEAS